MLKKSFMGKSEEEYKKIKNEFIQKMEGFNY